MPLSPIIKPAVKREFIAFDLEWVPAKDIIKPTYTGPWRGIFSEPLKLRVAGCYDGEQFRHYKTMGDFLEGELVPENKGKWFYAHAGGLADFQFVFDTIIRCVNDLGGDAVKIDAAFSGSAAIIVKVKRGKHTYTFTDSYWLLRAPLAKIGAAIGMNKLEEEKRKTRKETVEYYTNTSIEDLLKYNRQDCEILYEAVSRFQDTILGIGGQLQKTIASTGMSLFRRRFLSREILTSDRANEIGEAAYFASRVEVFQKAGKNFSIWDINSSFPYAMTFPHPGNMIGIQKRLPEDPRVIYFADVDIEVPDMYLPPVPYRYKGRLFFPTGKWRSWLTGIDIELLEKMGGRILKVHSVAVFESRTDSKDYAETVYKLRLESESGYEKIVYKLLLNSLYGKFAEGTEKESVLINPETVERKNMTMIMPGVWIRAQKSSVPHRHVPISAWITAIARRTLYEHLDSCYQQGKPSYYCDTDSIATKATLVSGDELGAMKLEKNITWAKFIAPKVYQGEGFEVKGDGSEVPVYLNKAKGFSLPRNEQEAALQLAEIIEGKEVVIQRMARIREVMRSGDSRPVETLIRKKLNMENAITKREILSSGDTRPWNVKHLEKLWQKDKDAGI